MCYRILDGKPKCFSHIIDPAHTWIEGSVNGKIYGYAALQVSGGVAIVHLHLKKWSHTILRELKTDFYKLIQMCRTSGATKLLVVNPNSDPQKIALWFKFIAYFGFDQPLGVAQMKI